MAKQSVPLLLDEQPILVYPSLAKEMGINKAVVFQQLHFLLNTTKHAANLNNYIDGQWWVYNTYDQWRENYFPWLSERSIKTYFLELEASGFVVSRQSVKNKSDRKKWYTINYDKWTEYVSNTMRQNLPDGSTGKNFPINGQKMSDGYTETTTETTTDIKDKEPTASFDAKPLPETIKEPELKVLDKPKRQKKDVDPAFKEMQEALRVAFKWDTPTGQEWGMLGKTAKELLKANIGIEQLPSLVGFCRGQWRDKLRPYHITSNVSEWRKTQPKPIPAPVDLPPFGEDSQFASLEEQTIAVDSVIDDIIAKMNAPREKRTA